MEKKLWKIRCDSPEIAAECAHRGKDLELHLEVEVSESPICASTTASRDEAAQAVLIHEVPELATLIDWLDVGPNVLRRMAICGMGRERERMRHVAGDLGIPTADEVGSLLAMLALESSPKPPPWAASLRTLDPLMRARLGEAFTMGERGAAVIERGDKGELQMRGEGYLVKLGCPRDVRTAALALRAATGPERPGMPMVQGVEREQVLETLFGPPRLLSDPASKAALLPYDLPMPIEELCTSPSRASAEATRIGFPVRVSLASPDLRIWDHPDLAIDGVDNATVVRDVFRQFMAIARQRNPEARLLGVTVSAAEPAYASLRLHLTPLRGSRVLMSIGFADPHGQASGDETLTVLPAAPEHLERVLLRLRGGSLILAESQRERRRLLAQLTDEVLRLGAFVHDWRDQIISLNVNPLSFLLGGAIEVREVSIEVGDSFLRGFEAAMESPQSPA